MFTILNENHSNRSRKETQKYHSNFYNSLLRFKTSYTYYVPTQRHNIF